MSMSLAPTKTMKDGVLVKKVLTPIVKKGGSSKASNKKMMRKGGMSRKSC